MYHCVNMEPHVIEYNLPTYNIPREALRQAQGKRPRGHGRPARGQRAAIKPSIIHRLTASILCSSTSVSPALLLGIAYHIQDKRALPFCPHSSRGPFALPFQQRHHHCVLWIQERMTHIHHLSTASRTPRAALRMDPRSHFVPLRCSAVWDCYST